MSPLIVGAAGIVALFVLILSQVPIAIAMIIVGIAGFMLQTGWEPALTLLASEPAHLFSSIDLATVPLFLMMGSFASVAQFSDDLYAAAAALFGHRRGGLAYATLGGCAAFGAICGSSAATAATFSKIALPEMLRRGYGAGFAAGTVAAGGALKSLIPPSLVIILYCIVSKTFIFDVFAAAAIPALLTIALNALAIWVNVRLQPNLAPTSERLPWSARLAALKRAASPIAMMAIAFGGLYSGIFTVNEAAAVAAILALAFSLVRRRMTWARFVESLCQAAGTSVMLYMILIGASVFTYFVNVARVPETFIHTVAGLGMPPLAVIFALLLVYIVLGTVFEEISAILITLPFVLPIIIQLGYDPIWWGVLMVIQVELALIHPPMGVIIFLLHGENRSIPMGAMYRGVIPFVLADIIVLLAIVLFPQIALWLPRLLGS